MELTAAMLANAAEVRDDGLLYVSGGGWEYFAPSSLPATIAGAVAGLLELGPEDYDVPPQIRLTIRAGSESPVFIGSMAVVSGRQSVPFAMAFTAVAESDDTLVFRLTAGDGRQLWEAHCPIRLPPLTDRPG